MARLLRERIGRHIDEVQRASATRLEQFQWGTAFLRHELPRVYDLNLLKVYGAPADVSVDGLIEEADRVMEGFGHRQIRLDDERLAERLLGSFDERGWKGDRHVVMARVRGPDRSIDTSNVVEVTEDVAWPAREQWLRSYPWGDDDDLMRQMREQYRILSRIGNGRDFAILEDGEPVSFALLYTRRGTAEVADVATLESHRGRGLARSVVWRAVEAAGSVGCDVVFLVADDRDWPKELYTKLGFDPVAHQHFVLWTDASST